MRLSEAQISIICDTTEMIAGPEAKTLVFGSRLDDETKGGDIDLLVELPHPVENAALLASRLEARLMLRLGGRKVDVLLIAPNLPRQPIHEIALREGKRLC